MNEMQSFYVRQKAAFDAFQEIEDQLREQSESESESQQQPTRMSLMQRFLDWLGQDSPTETTQAEPNPQSWRLNSR
jgi:hypothetical protein